MVLIVKGNAHVQRKAAECSDDGHQFCECFPFSVMLRLDAKDYVDFCLFSY